MDIERVRTVVLGGGRSRRMGFDKVVAPFAGEPLARRVAGALAPLQPLIVTTPQVAATIADLPGVTVIVTEPTAGPSRTLQLANEAIDANLHLAVVPCDMPFLDAGLVRAFLAHAGDQDDLVWPVAGDTPGHPVLWSPRARAHIGALSEDEPPSRVRRISGLVARAVPVSDDAYVTDVDTPDAWRAAERRATSSRR